MATEAYESIVEDFEFLDEWQDRYRYVIDLGKDMQTLPDHARSPAAKVEGCASQVWMVPEVQECGGIKTFFFCGDSDAMIVRGLIAVLRALYNGVPVAEIHRVDARSELDRLGLRSHLTAQRSNGLTAMVGRIRHLAESSSH